MTYPNFFNEIPNIVLQDDLADFLGAFENGLVEFSYIDIAKIAGHSCPTVLGAYLMTQKALEVLFKDEIAKRGLIKIQFNEKQTDGVAGVIANVMSNITGACTNNGFKGVSGKFNRNELLEFEKDLNGLSARFIRMDTNEKIDIIYNASLVPPASNMKELMGKILANNANLEEINKFKYLWQERVKEIFNNKKVINIVI